MRKFLILVMAALLFVATFAAPVAAVPVADLAQLAVYFPENTALFAAARTDDDFIETLDTVVSRVEAALPAGTLPVSTLTDALDFVAMGIDAEGDYESVIGSWLGDTIALGTSVPAADSSSQPVILAVAITDAAAAEAFLTANGGYENYDRTENDGYVLWSPSTRRSGQPFVIFREDVLIISMEAGNVETGGVQESPLSAVAGFNDTLALLPQDDYNVIVYTNFVEFLTGNPMMADAMAQASPGMDMNAIFSAFGPQVYGATILDGRSLTIDIVTSVDTAAMMESLGYGAIDMSAMNLTPVDPTFARFIPAGTPLVIHGTNLGAVTVQQAASLPMILDSFVAQGMIEANDARDARAALYGIGVVLRGLTGLTPEEAFGWMSGNYALYAGLSPSASDASGMMDLISSSPLDFALTIEATDAAAATALVDGLLVGLLGQPLEEVTVVEKEIDGASAFTIIIETPDLPFALEFMIATNENVLSIGTPRYVEFALNPGAGLDTDPLFQTAAQYVLSDSAAVAYLSTEQFQSLVTVVAGMDDSAETQANAQIVSALLSLVNSASISGTVADADNGVTYARLVWTLPE